MGRMKNKQQHYTHLSNEERERVFLFRNQGKSQREIGEQLGRNHRTIGRELGRNNVQNSNESNDHQLGTLLYSPSKAEELARERRRNSKSKKLDDLALRSFVIGRLNRNWSPEQIAGRLKLKAENVAVSHETIYQFVYARENKPLRLWEFLRRRYPKRRKKHDRKVKRVKHLEIPNRIKIDQRPEEANRRTSIGHWETDLIEGRRSSKDVVSIEVERRSRYAALTKLENKEAANKAGALNQQLGKLPRFLVRSVTFDNGTENYYHERVAKNLNCQTFFCNPYHSWEKGTVENSVGLVRQYLPKGADLSIIGQPELNHIAWQLNNRPRKILKYLTPREVIREEAKWGI